eukprot:352670-Chlamydomonas_euryale.AAC.3
MDLSSLLAQTGWKQRQAYAPAHPPKHVHTPAGLHARLYPETATFRAAGAHRCFVRLTVMRPIATCNLMPTGLVPPYRPPAADVTSHYKLPLGCPVVPAAAASNIPEGCPCTQPGLQPLGYILTAAAAAAAATAADSGC